MNVDGACHCGDITFSARVDPALVLLCHCTDCQTLSGGAYRTLAVATEGSFALLHGEPTVYVKVAQSGARRGQAFCPRCGTPLYSGPDGQETVRPVLRVGALAQRAELPPKAQIWGQSCLAWTQEIGSVPLWPKEPEA